MLGTRYTNHELWLLDPVQLKFTLSALILFTESEDGKGPAQDIQETTSIKSIATSPVKEVPLV